MCKTDCKHSITPLRSGRCVLEPQLPPTEFMVGLVETLTCKTLPEPNTPHDTK